MDWKLKGLIVLHLGFEIEDNYTRRFAEDRFFGRGFDSRHLHQQIIKKASELTAMSSGAFFIYQLIISELLFQEHHFAGAHRLAVKIQFEDIQSAGEWITIVIAGVPDYGIIPLDKGIAQE